MALRDLVEGECGRNSSVVKLTSHFVQDQSLKDEGVRHPFTHDDSFTTQSEQLIQQFFEETMSNSPTFRMDSLIAEMRDLESSSTGVTGPVQSAPVSQLAFQEDSASWEDQFLGTGSQFQDVNRDSIWTSDPWKPNNNQVSELGFGPSWAQDYLENQHELEDPRNEIFLPDISASEEYVEKSGTESELQQTANEVVSALDDSKFTYSKFMKFMRQIGDGGVSVQDGAVIHHDLQNSLENSNEVASLWSQEHLQNSSSIDKQIIEDSREWSEDFAAHPDFQSTKQQGDEKFSQQLWKELSERWEKMLNVEEESESWNSEFTNFNSFKKQFSLVFKEYTFAPENPVVNDKDAFEEGKKKLEAGDLPSAVLCFEAAAQQQPENAQVWQLLGTTQAENEQDPQAISALRKCLQLDPKNLTAWLGLAVSCANENFQNQACYALKEWIRNNPKYSSLVPPGSSSPDQMNVLTLMSKDLHDEIKSIFFKAARQSPTNDIDADVQCGLGVLFNLSYEYDKAIECFKTALQVRPNDAKLWNRLGATLANSERSEEAVDAYHNALQLAPGFIRARYNLGITCIHLKAYKEAAEHLLQALNFQAAGRGVVGNSGSTSMSDSIWATLRLVLSLLEKVDLIPAVQDRDLSRLNKEFDLE
nr:PREDICTED: peroxisomal targeting signal 1 receptor isoform X1 [Bemisia tabaci]XP_018910767.1 PREDICTED: peroxisomal targeting signal 1 receptor isoform X1 [Bemisia tabaci]